MVDQNIEDLPPHDRRRFFSTGLSRLLRPLADYIEEKLPVELPLTTAAQLRPPGAIEERQFLATCYRCGSCADACPVNAIHITQGAGEELDGTPYIDPSVQACVICDALACMKACPSTALKQGKKYGIRIGLAIVDHSLCVRSRGVDCLKCIEPCPLGDTAIRLNENGRVHVISPTRGGRGCIGCGVCQRQCPTTPTKAIRVMPT